MPWEKSFDEAEVVDQAMQVFWEKGYAATSISDITTATGIKRGSLYNAFAGKRDLFLQALLKYGNGQRREQIARLEQCDSACEAIFGFLDFIVQTAVNDPNRRGCLLINTSLDYAQYDEEIQRVVTDAFLELTRFFEKQIRRGQRQGEISETIAPRATANSLVSVVVGIQVLGRGAMGKTALQQMAEQAKRLVTPEC
ncbi:TetR/AcrR family transcriptional regulator [Rubinisphaera sp. JC750]|uniref:TetR/AcrR family transcriptional regulator n=1 Tax=Rubinisphaera sp. JC750 TaxID=2898658 RepID=UPI001F2E5D85|nr:TetR/AcrR family transcriptional regulator [Rubinisphaera sp. JC750]